ncbi:MAG: FAD-dependent thymidylate synthase [candidate division FCPU426 bacterium]
MQVMLLKFPQDPEQVVAQAARLCYSASDLGTIAEKLTPEKTAAFIRRLVKLGHHSALEHVSFTFGVEGVSRALTHQLVRHRLASYSQQSQRYVTLRDFPYVTPPSVAARPDLAGRFSAALAVVGEAYEALLAAGVPAEDARYLLPNACESKIVVTMNARELLHFFRLRCCNRAQWEIHELADRMLALAKAQAPSIFHQAGPGCASGPCPEGEMTCGKTAEVRAKYQAL